ncbi:MAG: hydroxyacylglutathione hydrolase [Thermomicrobiales bacterium]|nr:hydroxyacylglutathione hydrolase [Thermomicrobiales bacterium]
MPLTIESFVGGPIETNAFLVSDDESQEAIVIDAPMDVADRVAKAAKTAGRRITLIVITHTHWDHIGDAAELKESTGAPLVAHELAVERLANPGSATTELPFTIPPVTPDRLLADGDEVRLGEHVFRVMHLPGHDPAHIALFSEADRVFLGGDVLFPGGHGRVDIPGADQETMNRSLARLVDLPPDTVVYPGHGRTTTIGDERWLQGVRGQRTED